MAGGKDKGRGKDSGLFSYLEKRRTREGVPTPHLMEELATPVSERPSWSRTLAPLGFVVCMLALGGLCFWLDVPVVGVGFMLFGIVPSAFVGALVVRALPAVMGPHRDAGEEELGPYLGGGGDRRVSDMSPGLMGSERDVIEWNRAEEADRTWHWLQSQPAGFEEVETTSDDGTRLCAHLLACCPDSPRWLVFSHGFADNWRAGLTFSRRLAEAGFNLLLVDMRAHGRSGGEWVGAGWLDRRDLVAWSRWVVGRAGTGARIALMGISMGAASSVMASAEQDLPEQVCACVSDSAYTDFWNTAINVVSTGSLGTQPMPAHPTVDLARLLLRLRRGGYDIALSRPVDAIAHSRVPVLIVHGEDDKVVPPHMADELAAAAGGAAAGEGHGLEKFPAAGHCCAVFADPGRYWDAVLAFLGRWVA